MPFQMNPFGSPGPSIGGINQMALTDARNRAANMEMRVLGNEALAVELAKAKLDYRKDLNRERTRLSMREMDQAFGTKSLEQRKQEMQWYASQLAKSRELALSQSREGREASARMYREVIDGLGASFKDMMAPFALAAGKPEIVAQPPGQVGQSDLPADQSGIPSPGYSPGSANAGAGSGAKAGAGAPAPSPATAPAIDAEEFAARRAREFIATDRLDPVDSTVLLNGTLLGRSLDIRASNASREVAVLERFYGWLQSRYLSGWYTGIEAQYTEKVLRSLGNILNNAYMQNPEMLYYSTLKGAFSRGDPDLEQRAKFDDWWESQKYDNEAQRKRSAKKKVADWFKE